MSRSRKAPRTRRQARKAEARVRMALAGTRAEREAAAFKPTFSIPNPLGNRHVRRGRLSWRGEVGWRRKKCIRGEYYGRKLEELIRSGAPLARVRAERTIIRALLA